MQLDGVNGLINVTDGATGPFRRSRTGAMLILDELYDAALRGLVYTASTAVGGVAPGTAFSTTPPYTLYNPISSTIDVVVLRASLGYISGTLGAGTVFWGVNTNTAQAAPSGGTELTPVNNRIGLTRGSARVFQASTLAVAPSVFRPFCSLTALLATTAVQPYQVVEYVDGELCVEPGAALSLQATAAGGSSPLVALAVSWLELKRPS